MFVNILIGGTALNDWGFYYVSKGISEMKEVKTVLVTVSNNKELRLQDEEWILPLTDPDQV